MTNWHLTSGNVLRSRRETCRRFKSEITVGLIGVNCGRYLPHTFKFAVNNRPFLYQDVHNLWLYGTPCTKHRRYPGIPCTHMSVHFRHAALCSWGITMEAPLLAPTVGTSAPHERRLRVRIVCRRTRVSHRLSIDPVRAVAEGLNRRAAHSQTFRSHSGILRVEFKNKRKSCGMFALFVHLYQTRKRNT
jgi:hypothetical protein